MNKPAGFVLSPLQLLSDTTGHPLSMRWVQLSRFLPAALLSAACSTGAGFQHQACWPSLSRSSVRRQSLNSSVSSEKPWLLPIFWQDLWRWQPDFLAIVPFCISSISALHLWCPFLPSLPLKLRYIVSYKSSRKAKYWAPQTWLPWFPLKIISIIISQSSLFIF